MSFITPAPVPTPTFTSIVGSGGNLNLQHNMAASGQVATASVLSSTGTTMMNNVAGNAVGGASFTGINGFGRVELDAPAASASSFGWSSIGTFQPLSVGAGGATNGPNMGGFSVQIYAGIGDIYDANGHPAYFIGLTETLGNVTAQFSANIKSAMGIILDSTAAANQANWQWITRRGVGAAALTNLGGGAGVPAAAQQLFAVSFSCPPNSDAITMQVKQLTAAGTWTQLLAPTSLTGIGAPLGARLGPMVLGHCFAAVGGGSGIWFVRMAGLADLYTVPNAFPGQ